MQVLKWSDGSYLEDQDMWWLSGIHRSGVGGGLLVQRALCVCACAPPHAHTHPFLRALPLNPPHHTPPHTPMQGRAPAAQAPLPSAHSFKPEH